MDDKIPWPSWRYGPNGESQVFETASAVPAGWQDHPSKVVTAARSGSEPLPPQTDQVPPEQRGAAPVQQPNDATGEQSGGAARDTQISDVSNTLDADGWPWSAELHSATQSQTKAGLWRMKVGASRPDPKPSHLKPVLDL